MSEYKGSLVYKGRALFQRETLSHHQHHLLHTHTHAHTRTIPNLRWTYPQAELSLFSTRHTLCTVTASRVCPHLFSWAVPYKRKGVGRL